MADDTAHTEVAQTAWNRFLYRLVRGVIWIVGRAFWRVTVTGAAHIPPGPFILAPVHRSNVDSPLASLVTSRRMRFMGKEEMWKVKLVGKLWTAIGGFPVSRGEADREALRLCQAMIEAGEPLVMFPEGTRRSGPVVEDLYDGPAFVAARTQVPIVPVGIGGSEAAMPKGAKFLRPGRITLLVGPPLAPPAKSEGGRVPRSAVRDKTEELRETLQVLFDEAQRQAAR
jgi:1-acyl-sn-glycerol-3-phosphate acyltransferase